MKFAGDEGGDEFGAGEVGMGRVELHIFFGDETVEGAALFGTDFFEGFGLDEIEVEARLIEFGGNFAHGVASWSNAQSTHVFSLSKAIHQIEPRLSITI